MRSQTFLLGICLIGLSLEGCRRDASSELTATARAGATSDMSIDWEERPSQGAILPFGVARFEGRVISDAGLDPLRPLTVTSTSLDAGYTTTLDISPSANMESFINEETGEFLILLGEDYAIAEGPAELRFTFRDPDGEEVSSSWSSLYLRSPFTDFSTYQMAQARQAYGTQVSAVFSSYLDFIEQANPDPTAFPEIEFDLSVLEASEGSLLNFMVQHPNFSDWEQIASLWEQAAETWMEESGLSSSELTYRQYVYQGVKNYCLRPEMYAKDSTSAQFNLAGYEPGLPAPDMHLWALAFLEGTHFTTSITRPVANTFRFRLLIQTDQGVLPMNQCCEWPSFTPPIADTWQGESPVFELTVDLIDVDGDGDHELLEYDGSAEGQTFAQITDEPLEHYGHLASPLRSLQYSSWWTPIL